MCQSWILLTGPGIRYFRLEDLESSVYTIVPTYLQFRFLEFPAVQKWMILLMMNRQQFGSGPTLCHSAYIIHLTTSRKHFIMAQERKVFGDEEWDLKLAAHSLWRQQEAQARCSLGALSSLLLLAFEEGRGTGGTCLSSSLAGVSVSQSVLPAPDVQPQ